MTTAISKYGNKKLNTFVLFILVLIFLFFEITIWIKTNGYPAMKDQAETYLMYSSGNNYLKYGIVGLRGVDDYALGSSKNAHPYYATNLGAFSSFFSYLLQKIGIKTIPMQTFAMIFVFDGTFLVLAIVLV